MQYRVDSHFIDYTCGFSICKENGGKLLGSAEKLSLSYYSRLYVFFNLCFALVNVSGTVSRSCISSLIVGTLHCTDGSIW